MFCEGQHVYIMASSPKSSCGTCSSACKLPSRDAPPPQKTQRRAFLIQTARRFRAFALLLHGIKPQSCCCEPKCTRPQLWPLKDGIVAFDFVFLGGANVQEELSKVSRTWCIMVLSARFGVNVRCRSAPPAHVMYPPPEIKGNKPKSRHDLAVDATIELGVRNVKSKRGNCVRGTQCSEREL